jgi:hypothetical protein
VTRLAVPIVVFGLLHAAFFGDVVFGGRTLSAAAYAPGLTHHPVGADAAPSRTHLLDVEGAAWVDEPSPHLTAEAFAAGELPLWTLATGLGAPLAANLNSGAGNPLQLFLNLAPTPLRADVFHLARLLLLAVCTFVLLTELALAPLAAVIGAAIVAYGGYALAWIVHHPLSSELFLPIMLFGLERGRRGSVWGWAALALGAAGSLTGGKLQASLLCFAFAAVWSGLRGAAGQGGRGAATVAAACAGIVVGVAAAGFLGVPAAELMARASGLTLGGRAQLAGFTLPWPSLASLAAPALFTAPDAAFPGGLLTPAIGIGGVALAAVGCVARGAPLVVLARACVAWAAVLLLRNVGAFGDLAVQLPVTRGILFVKYTFTIVFALAVAAAIGLDAVLAGRVEAARARRALMAALLAVAVLAFTAVSADGVSTFPENARAAAAMFGAVGLVTALWALGIIGRGAAGVGLGLLVVGELWSAAPHAHPPRRDPYRAPAFVEYLRGAAPGRVIADPDLLVPLTSGAAGLRDLRAIDVLTPRTSYAFFTRLVSFCDRVIHFTVDPDVSLAATAPALDLAGVRWIVSRAALSTEDLAWRVRRQVGRERTARLLTDLVRLHTEGGPLAIGPVRSGDDERFAFTLTTPFTLDVTADSEAGELAFGALVHGDASGAILRVRVDGLASDAPGEPIAVPASGGWQEHRIALARAGERRRIRLRVTGAGDGPPARVSIGDLGFGSGAAVEARLAAERTRRHVAEAGAIREVFRDPAEGVVVYENTNVLPRAFRVRRVEPSPSVDAALTRLGDGFEFRHAALVEPEDVLAVQGSLGAAVNAVGDTDDVGTTEIQAESPGSVTIATAGTSPALLVLADLAYPGWRAEIGGEPAPVRTVDGVLRGVVVPAGAHVVTFRYRPTSLLVGILVTFVALATLVPYGRRAARAHAGGA